MTSKILPTRLPTGKETGLYLATDMGGTNLRTAAVHLLGDGRVGATVEKHEITHQLKPALVKPCLTGLPTELVAPQVGCPGHGQSRPTLQKGGGQTAINRGKVLAMGKGFDQSDVMGMDLKNLLEFGFKRKNLPIVVSAIINDNVSVILATGTNTAYIERASEMSKYKGPACDQMIHSTEWDAMGKA
ncbi:glucokinase [Podila horticola]|nr:glucokinase [Podila horticola]